jgi:hypothetical protein
MRALLLCLLVVGCSDDPDPSMQKMTVRAQGAEWRVLELESQTSTQQENYSALVKEFGDYQDAHKGCK